MSGLDFGISVNVPYATLRDIARDKLLERDLEIRPRMSVRIRDLELRGQEDKVLVTVQFEVSSFSNLLMKPEGRLVLLGSPHYDPVARCLSIGKF